MTQKQTILAALRAAGDRGVTNVELNTQLHIFRYSARIHELREEGHTIRTVPVSGATVRFVLEQEAPAVSPAPEPRAPVPDRTDAENGAFSSPPAPLGSGADKTAEASPEPLPTVAPNESSGDAQPGLFDLPPLSPYDQEAA